MLDFSGVVSRSDLLLAGAWLSLQLAAAAMVCGFLIAAAATVARLFAPRLAGAPVAVFVQVIRNTPLLVQAYLIYFGLPSLGLRLPAIPASVVALSIYVSAYIIEILRGGLEATGQGQVDAARALGLSRWLTLRLVISVPALAAVYPALTSQFVLLLLATSVVSTISTPELTAAANAIHGLTFRSFEVYIVIAVMYLGLAAIFRAVFAAIQGLIFPFQRRAA
ncbi:MAG TPA: amino acid ABC transporter permease [Acetobacteraceae bacterium]|nr:amino acid ABC transporter permease [Acetobacteraceae bacterium]